MILRLGLRKVMPEPFRRQPNLRSDRLNQRQVEQNPGVVPVFLYQGHPSPDSVPAIIREVVTETNRPSH